MTSGDDDEEEALLRSVALQNAGVILAARQRAKQDLVDAKEALEIKTSELAHSVSMLRATLEATTDAILVTDGARKITDFNEKYVRMWDLPREPLESRDHHVVLSHVAKQLRDPLAFAARIEAIYSSNPPESRDVLSLVDGRAIERFTRVQVVGGRIIGRVWCFRDVTEGKHAEEQRQVLLERTEAARLEADTANRAKDEFLAVVSHELRTPLNAISGWAQLLLSSEMSPSKRRHAIEVIERNAKVQEKLIEDLLDLSRIISGKVRLSVDPVEPADFVEMAMEATRPTAHAKDVTLDAALGADVGVVMGDRDRLQQIVWNLLTNAIKFTPKGGRVHVKMRGLSSSVEIVVEDNGQGIAAEFMPFVFERFRQADSSITRSRGGLGLGLAIVRHLVELHGGTVGAQSDGEGKGATFTLRLPVTSQRGRARASVASPGNSGSARQALASLPELDGLRILVVDDEADARDMLFAMFTRSKATVITASSATEALEGFADSRPDVVVSDIGMPEEDGYSLIRRIRALGSEAGGQTPAVALTAYAQPSDRALALKAGFDMHVAKPIDPAELVRTVMTLHKRHVRS